MIEAVLPGFGEMSEADAKMVVQMTERRRRTMTITLEVLEPTEIDSRVNDLLGSVQLSLEAIRERAHVYALSPREQGVLDQIEDLLYLRDAA